MNPPILAYGSPDGVLRQIARHNSALKALTTPRVAINMVTHLSLAYLIAKHAEQLMDRKTLRILVAGAEFKDAFDGGLPYGLIPLMLGSRSDICVDLIGPDVHPLPTDLGDILKQAGVKVSSRVVQGTVGTFLSDHPDTRWDVCLLPAPGMEMHHGSWMQDEELPAVLDRTEVTFSTSYSSYDRLIDHFVLTSYGYERPVPIDKQPFALKVNDVSGMLTFPSKLSPRRGSRDSAKVAMLDRWFEGSAKILKDPEIDEIRYGLALPVPGFRPSMRALIGDHFADLDSGRVYHVDEYGESLHFGDYPFRDAQLAPPNMSAGDFERLVWVLSVLDQTQLTPEAQLLANEQGREQMIMGDVVDRISRGEEPDSIPSGDDLEELLTAFQGASAIVEQAGDVLQKMQTRIQTDVTDSERALFKAAATGDADLVAKLLKGGARAQCVDDEGFTPLMDAARFGHLGATLLLLDAGADPNAANRFGWNCAAMAAQAGAWPILRAIVERGGDPRRENLVGLSAVGMAESLGADEATMSVLGRFS